jgi:protein-S-isoprenylcysteine O-methyltransferase Ste14
MEIAHFIWWLAAAAMMLPFVDVIPRLFARQRWIERATAPRLVLAVLEVVTLGAWLLVRGRWQFLPNNDGAVEIAGALLALTGAAFAAWARSKLGRLFSPQLGVQEQHRLITSGPYAVVRHPIYLGIIDFIIGTALFLNDVALFLAGLLFVIYFGAQIRIEERMLERHFGNSWREYRARVPGLFPYLRRAPQRGR